jgi:glucokinase
MGDLMKIITLDIGGTAMKYAYFDKDILVFDDTIPSEASLGGNKVLENINSIITKIGNQYTYDAIGISTAGQVDSETGTILYANENIPNYTGMELKKLLEDKFKVPVCVENDVNAAAIGEAIYGAGKGESDFLCLTYGTGIGGAIFLNHQLYKGTQGVAAEMGHMVTHPGGLPCGCGSFGCYEQYASTTALIRTAKEHNPEFVNGKAIFSAFDHESEDAKRLIDHWIEEISYGLINLIYVFNPSLIVLGGGIMTQSYILEKLNKIIKENTVASFHGVKIALATLGNLAGVYGMKAVASKEYQEK